MSAPERSLAWQAARLALYRADFPRFAAEQLKIVTKDPGEPVKPFHLYPFQSLLYQRAADQFKRRGWVRQVWLKGRQGGFSTIGQGIIFWRTVLHPNTNALVIAHDVGASQTIFQMARRFYEHLDPALKPMVRYSTKQELVFDNPSDRDRPGLRGLNSRIIVATARNLHSGAGSTLHCVHLSEAARYPNAVEIESAVLQAVPMKSNSFVIIESTARPEGHWFREQCDMAIDGRSPYEFQFVPWTEDPSCAVPLDPGEVLALESDERDLQRQFHLTAEQLKWRRLKLAEKRWNIDEFSMDYPLTYEEAWIMREFGVFPVHQLRALYAGLLAPRFHATVVGAKVLREHNGPLSVWQEPEAGGLYDIGADVALGVGQDWSTAQVLKRPTGEQVAEYRGQIEPGEFADVLDGLGRWYNTAQIAVEVNGVGRYTNARLSEMYPNLYIWRRTDKIKHRLSNFWGWETSNKSKQELVALAKDRLYRYATTDARQRFPLIRSEALYKELSGFVQEPGTDKYAAGPGYADDLVLAWMIGLKASSDEYGIEMESLAPADEVPAEHPRACTCRLCEPNLWLREDEVAAFTGQSPESLDPWNPVGWR